MCGPTGIILLVATVILPYPGKILLFPRTLLIHKKTSPVKWLSVLHFTTREVSFLLFPVDYLFIVFNL